MKKILLLLSCCFTTLCSVQAELKYSTSSSDFSNMSQASSSIMMASPSPAVAQKNQVVSAYYKADTKKLTVNCYLVNASSPAKIELMSTMGGANVVATQSVDLKKNPPSAQFSFQNLSSGRYVAILSVNGSRCADITVDITTNKDGEFINPYAQILENKVYNPGYNPAADIVKVDYTTANLNNPYIKIIDITKNTILGYNSQYKNVVAQKRISNSSTPASTNINATLEMGKTYKIALYDGSTDLNVSCNITPYASKDVKGHIQNVFTTSDNRLGLQFILTNTYQPRVCIFEGTGNDKKFVKYFDIQNSSSLATIYRSPISLKPNTKYRAEFADGVQLLGIYRDFITAPQAVPYKHQISSIHFDPDGYLVIYYRLDPNNEYHSDVTVKVSNSVGWSTIVKDTPDRYLGTVKVKIPNVVGDFWYYVTVEDRWGTGEGKIHITYQSRK